MRTLFTWLVCTGLVVAQAPPVEAQRQSPTQPKPKPNISELRQRLQKSISRLNKDKGAEAAKPAAAKKEPDDKAAGPEKPAGRPPGGRRGAKAGGGAAGVTMGKSISATARTSSMGAGGTAGAETVRAVGQGIFEPLKYKDIKYGELPDVGEVLTCSGPIAVGEFLDMVSVATEWNVLVTQEAKAVNLEFWIADLKPKQAIADIFLFHDLYYGFNKETNCLVVMTKEEHLQKEFGKLEEYEITPEHASVDYIESMLTALLSPNGRLIVDPRTLHIFIWDTNDNIAKMKETVAELDVPLAEELFEVEFAEIVDVETIVSTLLSPSGELVVDPRTGQLYVKDLPSNIEQVRAAIERLDVDVESRTFQIANVDAEAVIEHIEPLLTERGLIQSDARLNTIVVTDLVSRQDRIAEIIETLDRKLETRTWTLSYVEPDEIAERIETLVPQEMGDIVVDEFVHQLTVTALPGRLDEIETLIETWDIKRRQVKIVAYGVSMGSDLERKLNINWSYFDMSSDTPVAYHVGDAVKPTYDNPQNALTVGQLPYTHPLLNAFSGEPIVDVAGQELFSNFDGNRLAALLDYLDQRNDAEVISAPLVTVQDGEQAVFQSGREVPYVTSTSYGSGYGGNTYNRNGNQQTNRYNQYSSYNSYSRPYNRTAFISVGTILTVMPRISADDSVLLDISTEESDADMKEIVSSGEVSTIPEKRQSTAETQVRVQSGQTIIIGGLRRQSVGEGVSRAVPILSDIPVVGRLFKNTNKKLKDEKLMMFITPVIVDEYTHPEAERLANADEDLALQYRSALKKPVDRFLETLSRGKNEILVSIGESGKLRCEGKQMTIEGLRERFAAVKVPPGVTVVIRDHPRASEEAVAQVVDSAKEEHLDVEFIENTTPFVPDYGSETPGLEYLEPIEAPE